MFDTQIFSHTCTLILWSIIGLKAQDPATPMNLIVRRDIVHVNNISKEVKLTHPGPILRRGFTPNSPWGSTRYIVLIDHFLIFLLVDFWDIFCVVDSCLVTSSRLLRVSVGGIGSGLFSQKVGAGDCTTFFEKMLRCSTLGVHEEALKYLCIIAIISSTLRRFSSISVTVL